MRGLLIGIVIFFMVTMAVVWVASEIADPEMLDPPKSVPAQNR